MRNAEFQAMQFWCSGLSSFVLRELRLPSVSFAGFGMSALEFLGRSGKHSVVTQT